MEFWKTVAKSFACLVFRELKFFAYDTNVCAFESIGNIITYYFETLLILKSFLNFGKQSCHGRCFKADDIKRLFHYLFFKTV